MGGTDEFNKQIAKEVSRVVEKILYKIRSADPNNSFKII